MTLDTNCIINLVDSSSPTATSVDELLALMRHAMNGRVNLAVTSAIDRDLRRDRDDQRRDEMIRAVEMFPVISAPFRLDESTLDGRDALVSDEQAALARRIETVLFPGMADDDRRRANKLADVDHLAAHASAGRDVFVTDDGFHRKRDRLREAFGIEVMTPAEALERIERTVDTDLVAAEYRNDFGRVVEVLLDGFRRGASWTPEEKAEYVALRQRLLKAFPKLMEHLQAFRLAAASMAVGDGARILPDREKRRLQSDLDPFRRFYVEPTVEEVAMVLVRDEALLDARAFVGWVEREAARCDTLLLEFIGYLEATG